MNNMDQIGIPRYKFKNDVYRRARGGDTKLIDVYCAKCGSHIIVYQKDMPRGKLKRCYLDRIFFPAEYASLQDSNITRPNEIPKLKCGSCGNVIGLPTIYAKHGEHRLAYSMIQNAFIKKSSTHGVGVN